MLITHVWKKVLVFGVCSFYYFFSFVGYLINLFIKICFAGTSEKISVNLDFVKLNDVFYA